MRLVVLTNEQLKEELLSNGVSAYCKIDWINSPNELLSHMDADAVIDLLYIMQGGCFIRTIAVFECTDMI